MADNNWLTIVTTTTDNYLREVDVNTLRNRKLLALLQSKGNVDLKGTGGKKMNWKVKYKRAPMNGYADGDVAQFVRRDRYKEAELDWRIYQLTDMMSKKDRLMNVDNQAIINLYGTILEDMVEDIEEQFGDELYGDGYSAVDGRKLHGIESFCQGTAQAGQATALPTSTYAGLSCTPGTYGGNWSGGVWPVGTGDTHYDFWSPILVDYTSTFWGGTGQTWEKNCVDAIRFLLSKARRSKSKKGMMDLILLNDDLYRGFQNVYDDKQRIVVTTDSPLVKLGFGDVMNFDGCDITSEYGVPASTGYGFNTSQMKLISMQKGRLFVPTGPIFAEETSSYRFLIDFYGNMKFNPRCQGKLFPYT